MLLVQKSGVKLFRLGFLTGGSSRDVEFSDWIRQSEFSSQKCLVEKAIFPLSTVVV